MRKSREDKKNRKITQKASKDFDESVEAATNAVPAANLAASSDAALSQTADVASDQNARRGVVPVWKSRALTSEYAGDDVKTHGVDMPFLMITLLILIIGVIMVLSASFARAYFTSGQPMMFFMRQLVFAVSGVAIMLLVSKIKVRTMSHWSMHLLVVSMIMLVLVLLVGVRVNGAKRWLGIGAGNNSFTFQPSEIAKLAIIMSFAQMSCKFGKRMKSLKYGVAPFAGITLLMVALLKYEPHLSAIVIIAALSAIMMFAGGTQLRWFMLAALIAGVAASVFLFIMISKQGGEFSLESISIRQILSDSSESMGYAGNRISAWLNPDADPLGKGLQIRQSLFAVGSGGIFGQGLGMSRQKYLYLPEEHNDYIFAIVCEELGFIGALLILVLFALLIIRGFWLALHAADKYSSLITIGITSLLAIQVFLNVAVVTNLVPATGISLPFFSYGGTALWIQLLQMGIILAVSREIPNTATKPKRRA